MHKLGALPGLNSSFAFSVSDDGHVVGVSENGIDPLTGGRALEAVLWGKDGSITDLGDSGTPQVTSSATIFPIVISNPPPPVVSLTPLLPGATINQPFSYTFTATAGLPPYQNWTEKSTLPAGIASLTTSGVLAGTPTITGAFPISITVEDSLGQISAVQDFNFQVYQHGFKPTGSMGTACIGHTVTLLMDGTVLLAGAPGLNTAETYNPATGKFTPTKGSMSVDRDGHTATLLNTGKVLITTLGGNASNTISINDRGQVLGAATNASLDPFANAPQGDSHYAYRGSRASLRSEKFVHFPSLSFCSINHCQVSFSGDQR